VPHLHLLLTAFSHDRLALPQLDKVVVVVVVDDVDVLLVVGAGSQYESAHNS